MKCWNLSQLRYGAIIFQKKASLKSKLAKTVSDVPPLKDSIVEHDDGVFCNEVPTVVSIVSGCCDCKTKL